MVKGIHTFGGAKVADGTAVLVLGLAVLLMAGGYVFRKRARRTTAQSLMLLSIGAVCVGLAAIVIGSTSP
jgi:LPXTG-motif cell wall-anchored protein